MPVKNSIKIKYLTKHPNKIYTLFLKIILFGSAISDKECYPKYIEEHSLNQIFEKAVSQTQKRGKRCKDISQNSLSK